MGSDDNDPWSERPDLARVFLIEHRSALERRIIDTPLRPWLGYFMLLEDNTAFTTPVKPQGAVWPPDPAFDRSSYAARYGVFFERMVRERLLDAACLALGDKSTGSVRFPSETLSFQSFAAAIHGRCLQFMATNPDIDWGGPPVSTEDRG